MMIFVLLLVMGGLTYLLSGLSSEGFSSRRERQTQEALAQAREALIGYALRYREDQIAQGQPDRVYGYLPLPDLGTTTNNNASCPQEGCDAANFAGNSLNSTVIGRLPWRTLGIAPLRDDNGECLWLAVSGSHQRIQRVAPLNWDALGQLDIVVTNSYDKTMLQRLASNPHDRPVAIIFSPGPPIGTQVRSRSGADDVTECGGNYDPANYLDRSVASSLLDSVPPPPPPPVVTDSAYFTGSRSTVTSVVNLAVSTQGKIFSEGADLVAACSAGSTNCSNIANDLGLPLTNDALFAAIRKHAYFRTDINAMLDRITGCLRDKIGGGGVVVPDAIAGFTPPADKSAGRVATDSCHDDAQPPLGYFGNYGSQVFVATPTSGSFSVSGDPSCAGVLIFASQRGPGQSRGTAAERNELGNYIEGDNLTNFVATGTTFSGPSLLERVSATQSGGQDIVRCIPASASLVTVESPGLTAAGLPQLATYSAGTQTLTLGQEVPTALSSTVASDLFGCAWTPEARALEGGLRSYFKFHINDSGLFDTTPHEGFTFTVVDGDTNGTNVCGAAAQHIGYSGNNGTTPFIAPPKIAFEIDPRSSGAFDPNDVNALGNGRNDPSTTSGYRGGHTALVYWGGDSPLATTSTPPCIAPRVESAGTCLLPQEEDDNVHGQNINARADVSPPPANPSAPTPPLAVPPDSPAGIYKLDPSRSSVPVNRNFHVRVELTREGADVSLPTVRAATTAALSLATPGAGVDGVPLAPDDRILVKDQLDASQNGIYVWKGPVTALTRSSDAESSVQIAGVIVAVEQGSQNANTVWRQSVPAPVVGTSALRFARIDVAVATQANIDLAAPGISVDGARLKIGDRLLVKAQTVTADNGIYVWNGSAVPMSRAPDADTPAELQNVAVQIQRGSDASAWWRFNGVSWQKVPTVRVASQTMIDLNAPDDDLTDGIDGIDRIPLVAGNRVLVGRQANPADNGIYIWSGPAFPMVRASDADASSELATAMTQVLEGSDSGRVFRQYSLLASDTLGTAPVSWVSADPSPRYRLEVWILLGDTFTNQIAAMKNTTRPMSLLYPGFTPHLRNTPTIPYPFRRARLGFTTGQRTGINDQTIIVSDIFTTWLP